MGKTYHVPLRNRAKILTEDRAIKWPNSTVLTLSLSFVWANVSEPACNLLMVLMNKVGNFLQKL